ncbi:MAG: peptide deformylase [Mycobacteriales bacterium]
MPVQSIRLLGDPVLRTPAEPVTTFDRELRRLVSDLEETLEDAAGAGLAAPQIGVSLRVFVYEVEGVVGHLANPILGYLTEEEQDGDEGCLSLPGLTYPLRRRAAVIAHGCNEYGDPVVVEGSRLLARCLQHETDHLDGVLFIDRLDRETKKAALKAIREASWAGAPPPVVKASPHPLFGVGS